VYPWKSCHSRGKTKGSFAILPLCIKSKCYPSIPNFAPCLGRARLLPPGERHVKLPGMSTLAEIEKAVDALPSSQQEELLRHLAERLGAQGEPKRRLPLVPATGHPITQLEIDDALDAD
jgi:hypothetical protein